MAKCVDVSDFPSYNCNGTLKKASSCSSVDSISPEFLLSDYFSSDELDKLSGCLSEASSDGSDEQTTSVFYDIVQAQLALWTYVGSLLYSYAWLQHRKKFLLTMIFSVPTVFCIACSLATLLTVVVIGGRLFGTGPIDYSGFSLGSANPRRRTPSGHSRKSSISCRSSLSLNDEQLPIPLCRRHSTSTSRPPSRQHKTWSMNGGSLDEDPPVHNTAH